MKEEHKIEEQPEFKGELYDLGDNYIKSIKDYEVIRNVIWL